MPEGPEQSHYFGGGGTETVLSPIVLVALIIALLLILVLPRKYVIVPVLLIAFLVPMGQSVYAVGVHWLVLRIITLCGLLRVAIIKFTSKQEFLAGGVNSIDKAFLVAVICQAIGTSLQYMDPQALVNQFGFLVDLLGGYFLLRALIREESDVYRTLKWLAGLTVILAVGMVWEQVHLYNVFGQIGLGRFVPEIREGKIRSQGVFQHSLTAGTFGATLLPLFFLLWKFGRAKAVAAAGAIGCTVMTICSNSSTPLLAYVAGLFAMCCWPLRKKMRAVRWGIVAFLLTLQVVMKAPCWFIIAHIDLTGGSSGYHRAELIDQFIRHFSDWWLIGTKDAGTWAYDLWDQQNQYVSVGEGGGLIAFVFFIVMISRIYGRIGTARKADQGRKKEWYYWFLGAALFSNLVAFFGVNYFDQVKVSWFALIAMICATAGPVMKSETPKPSSSKSRLSDPEWAESLDAAGWEEPALHTSRLPGLSTPTSNRFIQA